MLTQVTSSSRCLERNTTTVQQGVITALDAPEVDRDMITGTGNMHRNLMKFARGHVVKILKLSLNYLSNGGKVAHLRLLYIALLCFIKTLLQPRAE